MSIPWSGAGTAGGAPVDMCVAEVEGDVEAREVTCAGSAPVSRTALLISFLLSYFVFLVPFPSMTPGRFAHRLCTHLWTSLAFSRDFHICPCVPFSFSCLLLLSGGFPRLCI